MVLKLRLKMWKIFLEKLKAGKWDGAPVLISMNNLKKIVNTYPIADQLMNNKGF